MPSSNIRKINESKRSSFDIEKENYKQKSTQKIFIGDNIPDKHDGKKKQLVYGEFLNENQPNIIST